MFELITTILLLSIFITLYRFLKGTTLADRVVAFDVMSVMSVSLLVILSLYFQRGFYLDVALVFGLIGFLGSSIFGRFIERGI
ncbi:MAG: monovalent cation/H+ antiporter complex subunit F [Campylobacterota bacterium]|nr:monovalent cation/H+ antiporter complex subunit F [Campylobacterota bacterium]